MQYLNKRDDRGLILRYSAHELAYDISYKALSFINCTKVYNILIKEIPQQYVDIFYKKMIYEAFLPIAHQLVIYQHDKKNYEKLPKRIINADSFPCQALLKQIWPYNSVEFSISHISQIKNNIKDQIKSVRYNNLVLKSILNILLKSEEENSDLNCSNIAVHFGEGFDIRKRSDFFWFFGSGIDPSSVIVYYESPKLMSRFDSDQTSEDFFRGNSIKQIKLWEWQFQNKMEYFKDLKLKLRSLNSSDEVDSWLKRNALDLCRKSSFWASFFCCNNIKIHLDSSMGGLDMVIKQIAINHLGGSSVGKLRSYPVKFNGCFFGFFPNDIFFTWGVDSAKMIYETNKHINSILISGYPYKSIQINQSSQSNLAISRIKQSNTKFNILLLDTNHGSNEGLEQFIPTDEMVSFYTVMLDWVMEDKDIGLYIKPKKSHFLDGLPGILNQIDELEKNIGRVVLIKDSFQKMPSSYLNGIDMVIGISVFMPSAVIECVVYSKRAVFYDFPNLRHYESELYKWGENQVVFPNLNKMITTLKKYKNDPLDHSKIGDWSDKLNDLDPFRDNKGSQRIGSYIRCLQEGYKAGKSRSVNIDNANKMYAKSWGEDKIYQEIDNAIIKKNPKGIS